MTVDALKKSKKFKWVCTGFLLLFGLILVICGVLVLLFFRDLVDGLIKSQIPLREGSQIAQVWAKPPIKPLLKLYFFNVTNPRRFLKGAKPVLKEVGPFVYEEKWEKVHINWLNDGEEVEFGQRKEFYFRKDLSVADEDFRLTLPNIPMLSALAAINGAEELVQLALGSMLEILDQKPFDRLTVKEITWGYDNPLIKLGNDIFEGDRKLPFDNFGLFVDKNGTFPGILRTKTGTKNVMEIGQIVSFDNKVKLDFWKTDECNAIRGTDGSTFHPDVLRNETLHVFNKDLCQSLPLVYQEDVVSSQVNGYRFVPPEDVFATPEEKPYNDCYCMVEAGCNVPRGLFNLSACQYGSPVMMSWPHFFQADPKLLDDVDGLSPSQEKHQFYLDIQPKLGTSLGGQARSQINIAMRKTEDIKQAEGLRDIIFPIMWLSTGIETITDATTLSLLKTAVQTPEKARSAMYPTFFVAGVAIILVVLLTIAYRNYYKPIRSKEITPRQNGKPSVSTSNGQYEMNSGRHGVILASSS